MAFRPTSSRVRQSFGGQPAVWLLVVLSLPLIGGCGRGGEEASAVVEPEGHSGASNAGGDRPVREEPSTGAAADNAGRRLPAFPTELSPAQGTAKGTVGEDPNDQSPKNRNPDLERSEPSGPSEQELQRGGLRRIVGKHLTLITDLPPAAAVDELPQVFERAIPSWCDYFGISPEKVSNWQVVGYLMKDRRPFVDLELIPGHVPPFNNGYATRRRLWFDDQPSDYYRRHLLLHEGTHAFMFEVFGSCGPSWYMEGMAELLATHRWHDDKLTMGYFPNDREEVALLGRIRMVRDEVAAGRTESLRSIMAYDGRAYFEHQVPYGWSWALCAFLDGHPRYQQRFRELSRLLETQSPESSPSDKDLTATFRQVMDADWHELNAEWQLFTHEVVHGHDLKRTAIEFAAGEPLEAAGRTFEVDSSRGWQSSGIRLEAGRRYQLQANGRYQIASEPKVWWCEPGGVTIRYHRGQPLGILLAALRPDIGENKEPKVGRERDAHGAKGDPPDGSLLLPRVVGLKTTWRPTESGTLYLRINDSAADLGDNSGSLVVEIRELSD